MTNKTSIKVLTTTGWTNVNMDRVLSAVYEDSGKGSLSKLSVVFDRRILNDATFPSYQSEIALLYDTTTVFGGKIDKPISDYPLYEVVCFSYGDEFLDRLVNEIYENQDVGEIFKSIIDTYTNLTYASTTATGITVEKIVFRDKTVAEVLTTLANTLGYQFYTNYNKKVYFEIEGGTASGITFTVGSGNVVERPIYDRNTDLVITNLTVEGGLEEFNTTESFASTSGQTDFIVTYEPIGNIVVTQNSVELVPEIENFTTTGDYVVNKEQKTITLNSGATSGDAVNIGYAYARPVRVTSSIEKFDDYGNLIIKEKKIKNKAIKKYQEARNYASKYLAEFSEPRVSTKLSVINYTSAYKSGDLCTVVDDQEDIKDEFVMKKVFFYYPDNRTIVQIGSSESLIYDWQAEVYERLRELEQSDTNTDILQVYQGIKEKLNVFFTPRVFAYNRSINDSFILGTTTAEGASELGIDPLGDRRDGDDFESYTTSYNFTDTWSGIGISTTGETMVISPLSTAVYKGWSSPPSLGTTYGKLVTHFDADNLGILKIMSRYTDSSNHVGVQITSDKVEVFDTISGSTTTYASVTGLSLSGDQIVAMRFMGTVTVYNYAGDFVINNAMPTYTTSGQIAYTAKSGQQVIQEVEIYVDGVNQ